jgi:putative nucleotidyltransferase with HDIG domain
VAVEVVQLAQKPAVHFPDVVRALEKDPVLAAKVVSLAQSAAYAGRGGGIVSLYQATVRLGIKQLRDLVVEASLQLKVFKVPGYGAAMTRLARHSTATAHVMRSMCRRVQLDAEHAFLAGLLHDVGIAGGLLALAEEPRLSALSFEALGPVLEQAHQQISLQLTRTWKLLPEVQELVSTHHAIVVGGRARPLNAALILAEQLVWEAGAGLAPAPDTARPTSVETPAPPPGALDAVPPERVAEALMVLKLDRVALATARGEAFQIVKQLG